MSQCVTQTEEIAYQLLDIFTIFGAPSILHSDNGREFVNKIVTSVCEIWPQVKIVHGKARHSQSQGSVERANQDIESMIATWMQTNDNAKWSESLRFVQAMKNSAFHSGIKRTPYEAMFECTMKMGLATSSIPKNVITELIYEDDKDKNEKVNEKILLKRSTKIKRQRMTLQFLEKQAKKMKTISNKNFPAALIGQTVRVKIPDFDRCKIDSRTLLAVVVEVIDDEFYRLESKAGTLNQLFTRNQFTLCDEKCISISDVPNTTTSIRQAVAQLSLSGGQGFLRCDCQQKCTTKKCKCRQSNLLCNSRCHNSATC
ncbi:KRAB-A domain-containing protein 2-like, partial [Aphis craccivora]